MMKKISVIILGFLLVSAAAAEEVDRTIDAAPDGQVDVSNIAGSITVKGWSREQVEVTGTLGNKFEEVVFVREDDTLTLKVKVP